MGSASRRKGLAGEREVAAIYQQAGFDVRGLEGLGDHLVIPNVHGLTIHSEVKRTENFHRSFIRQAEAECPQGCVPVLCWRPSREPWRAMLPLTDFVMILKGAW